MKGAKRRKRDPRVWSVQTTRPFLFSLAVFTLAPSLQNRRISEASAIHERAREAREVREFSSPRTQLELASLYACSAGY